MKRVVYLTFYYQPDLCAGSFRNTPLAIELAKQLNINDKRIANIAREKKIDIAKIEE